MARLTMWQLGMGEALFEANIGKNDDGYVENDDDYVEHDADYVANDDDDGGNDEVYDM